jgi:hypothetical protein
MEPSARKSYAVVAVVAGRAVVAVVAAGRAVVAVVAGRAVAVAVVAGRAVVAVVAGRAVAVRSLVEPSLPSLLVEPSPLPVSLLLYQ